MITESKLNKKTQNKFAKYAFTNFALYLLLPIFSFSLVSLFGAEDSKNIIPTSERTLSIIKPDAVEKNQIGNILSRFEKNDLKIVAAKMIKLSKNDAESFYEVHKGKPFYDELVNFMSEGPIMVTVLEGENAIAKNREIMGATDPKKAKEGTIRKDLAQSVGRNAVHGSDAAETAKKEIAFFFKNDEIFSR